MFTLDYEANNAPLSSPSTSTKHYFNDTQLLFRQFCALPIIPLSLQSTLSPRIYLALAIEVSVSKGVGPHMEKRMTTDKIGLEHKSFAFGHDSKQTELQLRGGFSIIVNV